MDPVSIGVAVAALLAAKTGEAIGGEAGKSAWTGMKRLCALVRQRFAADPVARGSLERLENDPGHEAHQHAVAQAVEAQARADPAFAQELGTLVSDAQRHPGVSPVLTQISGHARVGKLASFGYVEGDVSF